MFSVSHIKHKTLWVRNNVSCVPYDGDAAVASVVTARHLQTNGRNESGFWFHREKAVEFSFRKIPLTFFQLRPQFVESKDKSVQSEHPRPTWHDSSETQRGCQFNSWNCSRISSWKSILVAKWTSKWLSGFDNCAARTVTARHFGNISNFQSPRRKIFQREWKTNIAVALTIKCKVMASVLPPAATQDSSIRFTAGRISEENLWKHKTQSCEYYTPIHIRYETIKPSSHNGECIVKDILDIARRNGWKILRSNAKLQFNSTSSLKYV